MPELVEDRALGVVRLDRVRNPLDRPIGQPDGLSAAEIGFDAPAPRGAAESVSPAAVTAARAARAGRRIGAVIAERVGAEHAVVEVVVRVRPERVIGVGIEGVVDEVVVGVRPEQRADPADHDRAAEMAPPLRVEEAALEGRARKRARAGIARRSQVGEALVAQHAAGERSWIDRIASARGRLRNGACDLVRWNDTALLRRVLLWRGARGLIVLTSLRRNVLLWRGQVRLWSGVAAAVRRRCSGGSAGGATLASGIFARTRLRLRDARAAAAVRVGATVPLLLRRRPRRRRRMPRHARGGGAAGMRGVLRRQLGLRSPRGGGVERG